MNILKRSSVGLMGLVLASSAYADVISTTMPVTAAVVPACAIEATAMDFGNDFFSDSSAQAGITVTCDDTQAYNVTMDAGQNLANTSPFGNVRHMASADAGSIAYRLNKTAAGGGQWGDSDFANSYAAGSSVAGTGNGTPQVLTVFGETIKYNGGIGDFSDTVTVSVNF